MTDPAEALIKAWVDWEDQPGSRAAAVTKCDALEDLGLNNNAAHRHIADWRRRGYSIPDAIQALVNDGVDTDNKESA